MHSRTIETPIGALTVTAESQSYLDNWESQLREYFTGTRRVFDLPMLPVGTDFQRAVWQRCAEIPYGETMTYGQLAESIGRPKAARAVGAALGANPLWIVVPCHRVVGASGSLTGFAGGLDAKAWLLSFEGVTI